MIRITLSRNTLLTVVLLALGATGCTADLQDGEDLQAAAQALAVDEPEGQTFQVAAKEKVEWSAVVKELSNIYIEGVARDDHGLSNCACGAIPRAP